MKKLLYLLLGVAIASVAVPMAQKLTAQSSATTRIYIPWFNGQDAGYTSLLFVNNTSMDPYGTTATTGTCNADVYFNGSHFSGSLGSFPPGQVMAITQAEIEAATNVDLANSSQRVYMFLTCNFKYAHASVVEVNPGGVVSFINGFVVPPNRSLSTGPEQLLQ